MQTHRPILTASILAALAALAFAQSAPFNGKNLDGWTPRPNGDRTSRWVVGSASLHPDDPRTFQLDPQGQQLINHVQSQGQGLDLYTKENFADCLITFDVMLTKGSNSGLFLMGEYELQLLDSYGKDQNPGLGDMGAIYGVAAPTKPTYRKFGEWSSFQIHFRAPRFDPQGKKLENARFLKVILNDRTIHENLEISNPTPGGLTGKEHPQGPILLQGDHGAVSFRKLAIQPLPN